MFISPSFKKSLIVEQFQGNILSNWKEEAWNNQGFNGIRSRDLREMPVRCSTNWAMKPHILRLFLSNCFNWKISWLQWSFLTFIYNRSSDMNYFIYNTSQSPAITEIRRLQILFRFYSPCSSLAEIMSSSRPNYSTVFFCFEMSQTKLFSHSC